ncbi:MAG: alpha/beta hydrolase [Gammaproteobacteria bacterium TMED186]|nr:MAG: alpha/beta hydrolase [Gammaproteobacteria bacterium TMED186]|tara:strand:+ start:3471 stop:4346 length:876 start_codon:yes stop_codon:yes gene_type:complete
MYKKSDNSNYYLHNFSSIDYAKDSLLFIPGAGMDHRIVKDINLDPGKFNKTLAIDTPHHGYSTGPKLTSIEQYAEGIETALDGIDISKFHLCGHSMGGLIALRIAFNKKLKFKSINILNASCPMFVGSALLDDSRKNLDSAMNMLTTYGVSKAPKAKASGPMFGTMGSGFYQKKSDLINTPYGSKKIVDKLDDEVDLYALKKLFNQITKDILNNDLNACKNFAISDSEISEYEETLNFILGEKDNLTPVKYAQKFCENLKKSEIIIIEELGHFTFYEDPTKLSEELGKLLS